MGQVANRIAPSAYPLLLEWDGPTAYGDASAYADRTVAAFGAKAAQITAADPKSMDGAGAD